MLPETASEAVAKWNEGADLDAVPIVPGLQAEQQKAWTLVFEILAKWPGQGRATARDFANVSEIHRWTFSSAQFDSWCYKEALAWPSADSSPKEVDRLETIRAVAYAILREGFSNVIERKSAGAGAKPRIVIRKNS